MTLVAPAARAPGLVGRSMLVVLGGLGFGVMASEARAQAAVPAAEARSKPVELLKDGSVEESLARKVNIDFNSVRIDGEKSNVPLSSLTADLVEAAESTKVPTPDLDADAVGGLLQLTSKRTFLQAAPTLRGSAGATYNTVAGRLSPEGSISFGRALGRPARWGFLASLSLLREYGADQTIDPDWKVTSDAADLQQVALAGENVTSRQATMNAQADWKVGERTFLQVRGSFDRESSRSRERELTYRPEIAAAPAMLPSEIERALNVGAENIERSSLNATLTHEAERWSADLKAGLSRERKDSPQENEYRFLRRDVAVDYRFGDPAFPELRAESDDDPAAFMLDRLIEGRSRATETDAVASLDLRFPLPRHESAWLKTGAKARALRLRRAYRGDVYRGDGDGLALAELEREYANAIFHGRYDLGWFPTVRAAESIRTRHPARLSFDEDETHTDSDPVNFDVRQDIFSGYAMGALSLGERSRVLAGLRAERTVNTFRANEVLLDDDGGYESTRPVTAASRNTSWFPGVHYTRELAEKLELFASWTRSIRRPDYDQLAPFRITDRSSREIEEGNPHLRPTLYTNYDLAFSYEFSDDSEIGLEFFHRELTDTRIVRRTTIGGGPFDGYERIRPENGANATLQGVEINWEQALGAWAGGLENWTIEASYTWTRSAQRLENRPGERILFTEQPEHELSVQLGFTRGAFYGSLSFEYTSRSLLAAGAQRSADLYAAPETMWDLSLSYDVAKNCRLFLDVQNLTDSADRNYQGLPRLMEDHELDRAEFRCGVKWER